MTTLDSCPVCGQMHSARCPPLHCGTWGSAAQAAVDELLQAARLALQELAALGGLDQAVAELEAALEQVEALPPRDFMRLNTLVFVVRVTLWEHYGSGLQSKTVARLALVGALVRGS